MAPDILYAEVGNIVWKKHRFQGMSSPDAHLILETFQLLTFSITLSKELLTHAYQLATAHQRTVYDALYLALSQRENCPFVTADEKFANSVKTLFPDVVWVADWV